MVQLLEDCRDVFHWREHRCFRCWSMTLKWNNDWNHVCYCRLLYGFISLIYTDRTCSVGLLLCNDLNNFQITVYCCMLSTFNLFIRQHCHHILPYISSTTHNAAPLLQLICSWNWSAAVSSLWLHAIDSQCVLNSQLYLAVFVINVWLRLIRSCTQSVVEIDLQLYLIRSFTLPAVGLGCGWIDLRMQLIRGCIQSVDAVGPWQCSIH